MLGVNVGSSNTVINELLGSVQELSLSNGVGVIHFSYVTIQRDNGYSHSLQLTFGIKDIHQGAIFKKIITKYNTDCTTLNDACSLANRVFSDMTIQFEKDLHECLIDILSYEEYCDIAPKIRITRAFQ